MQLLEQVRAAIRRHDLVRPGMRVLVALSGGPDSVALAHICKVLHDAGDFELSGVAHLNHGLREGAADDAAFCAEVASSLGVPIEGGVADVRKLAMDRGISIEAAAHDARYVFLAAAARRQGAERIALGHTLDDQAETVLLRLLRGAGSRGLAGMHPRRGPFIRPVLGLRRTGLHDFLSQRGIRYRVDPTNADFSIPRNRLRGELLPVLERDYNPQIVQIIGQEAELARDEWDWLNISAEKLRESAVSGHLPELSLDVDAIQGAHPAVARAVLRIVLEQASGGRPIAWPHVTRAYELFGAVHTGVADFPGQRLERRGAHVVLTSRLSTRGRTSETVEQPRTFHYSLAVPGETRIPEAGATMVAEVESAGALHLKASDRGGPVGGAGDVAVVRLDRFDGKSWAVRSRKPGDRLTWRGLGGRKKIHDLFVDRKVPRAQRDRIPIVVDAQDRIVWVAGHGVAGEFRVTDPAQAVVVLRLKLWGGSA